MPKLTRLLPVLREPLVHFLLGGLAIFAFFAVRGTPVDPASRTIIVDAAQVEQLAVRWQQTWQRAPTQQEIDALIRDFIKEEVYYREAIRLGLDDNDAGIRQRLRVKMEFLAAAQIESVRPADAVLQQWLDRNPARYAADARHSFDQIYLTQPETGAAETQARKAQSELARGREWQALGASIALPRAMDDAGTQDVARLFGPDFAAALAALPRGQWSGPVASGFGHHLVRVRASSATKPPTLADVRGDVENDWRAATAKAREAQAYQLLLDSYAITIRP